MHNLRFLLSVLFLLIYTAPLFSQAVETDSVADTAFMVSNNKIYVVGAVVITILAGLIVYVARLDRKISRMEKENT